MIAQMCATDGFTGRVLIQEDAFEHAGSVNYAKRNY